MPVIYRWYAGDMPVLYRTGISREYFGDICRIALVLNGKRVQLPAIFGSIPYIIGAVKRSLKMNFTPGNCQLSKGLTAIMAVLAYMAVNKFYI
jgi:hypothetical protein